MTGDEVQMRHTFQVSFTVGDDYKDAIGCGVLPMDSGNSLLGRPWMYDKNGAHGMHDNTYTSMYSEKEVTHYPKKPESQKKRSRALTTKEVLNVHHDY